MARQVEWAPIALSDLEEIAEFIARDSEHYAASFVAEVVDASRTLTDYAERGRVVPEVRDAAVRELLVGNYRLVYEIGPDVIYVLGVIHGARNLERLWRRQDR